MEEYITGTGQRLRVHSKEDCTGTFCVIHHPSAHSMRDFPTHWRADRGMMERICPHGIGHPDPDDVSFATARFGGTAVGKRNARYYSVHGCDGCCADKN